MFRYDTMESDMQTRIVTLKFCAESLPFFLFNNVVDAGPHKKAPCCPTTLESNEKSCHGKFNFTILCTPELMNGLL
jgi:hypothetical protein